LVAAGRVYLYEGGPSKDRYKFFAADALTAFSAEDGKSLWRQPKVGKTNGSVVLWTNGGKNYLISGAPGGPYCVDPDTGAVLWAPPKGVPTVNGHWECDGTPAISGDIAVLYSSPRTAFKITPEKAELLWKLQGGSRGASPLVYQDHAYYFGAQGEATCVDLKTGAVKWQQRGISDETSSPILADGKIFYLPVFNKPGWSKPSNIGMFKASPEKFEELGRFPAWTSEHSSPAIAGGKLYVRMKDHVACYDLRAEEK
jgi:outer membrane protein assembly factor BamB